MTSLPARVDDDTTPDAETSVLPRSGWIPGTTRIAFGGDYNPEQWPRAVWLDDVALMREIGVDLVSIGIFSWALLEPRPGEFDFGWLDEVIGLLHENGIGVDLGTPTASPPAWFWSAHPEARPVTRDGVLLGFGSRGMASPSSPEYHEAAARITSALGERYGAHPAVKLWHVHNEYGAPISESFDESSVRAFRVWLEERYGSLEALNTAWGTTFWGQYYYDWAQIDAPRTTAAVVNPAQKLDWARFSNHAILQCFVRERDILHRLSPGVPVTTNFMATNCLAMDYWSWAREVDIVSNDHYLVAERPDNHILLALDADLTRSLAGGDPWLLMEHSTSAVNWQPRNLRKQPGELVRNSMQHFARGADGILFFQWRASRFGAEKFHSAMIPHAGTDSRQFRELTALGAELDSLADALCSRVTARVAILWDWESFWAQDAEMRPSVELDHRRQVETYYSRLWHDGVTVDFRHPSHDLSGYDLVIAPMLYVLSLDDAEALRVYVENGGVFVAGYFSGIVDGTGRVHEGPMPGALRSLLGASVQEFAPLRDGEVVRLSTGVSGSRWTDDLRLEGADAVAVYETGPVAGGAAVTRHRVGLGSAWYVSTDVSVDELRTVLAGAYADAGIVPTPASLDGVEGVVRRGDDGRTFTTWINHTAQDATLPSGATVAAGGVLVERSSAPATA
ncbi:beta-galactosidase [Herbiconiux moechotypicola]|uniref:Beta-galactosidase n=1 Tax=Herbiconiux moechotypicola TaxID=637393 RepID=A0ABN3D9F8_9MICO|nr:beta-galactosidase [Herbiconiux moechotypicola]MCS5728209.1 beta-galactosidase [Herbiconiux moechotypicola]